MEEKKISEQKIGYTRVLSQLLCSRFKMAIRHIKEIKISFLLQTIIYKNVLQCPVSNCKSAKIINLRYEKIEVSSNIFNNIHCRNLQKFFPVYIPKKIKCINICIYTPPFYWNQLLQIDWRYDRMNNWNLSK